MELPSTKCRARSCTVRLHWHKRMALKRAERGRVEVERAADMILRYLPRHFILGEAHGTQPTVTT